mmetsp:Transcript_2446/g.4566  ORF Transcript_2446/g.4566 Transcript_2446/m.4566 type:complete len:81 (-) Transcript_2446:2540-2782(-)
MPVSLSMCNYGLWQRETRRNEMIKIIESLTKPMHDGIVDRLPDFFLELQWDRSTWDEKHRVVATWMIHMFYPFLDYHHLG